MIRDVGVNPTRIGLLEALWAMGAAIELRNPRTVCGEPIADLVVTPGPLRATSIGPNVALRAIDEIPLLAIAAAFASGTTTIAGVGELRSKESDRIAAIERLLAAVGIEAVYERGVLRVTGGSPAARGVRVETHDDHRIAMAVAVLGCAAGPLAIDSDESLDVSFPGFLEALRSSAAGLSGRIGALGTAFGSLRCRRIGFRRTSSSSALLWACRSCPERPSAANRSRKNPSP